MVKKSRSNRSSSSSKKTSTTTKPKVAKRLSGSDRATQAYNRLRKTLRE